MLVVLDLDNTLFAACYNNKFPKNITPDFVTKEYSVKYRPHLKEFLEYCFDNFEVGVYSAAEYNYCHTIMKPLMKDKLLFLYTEEDCILRLDGYKKGCKEFEEIFDANDTIIIDDKSSVWNRSICYDNVVKIKPFELFNDVLLNDDCLLRCMEKLEEVKGKKVSQIDLKWFE